MQTAEQRRLLRLAASYNKKAAKLGASGTVTAYELYRLPMSCHYCGIGLEEGQGSFDHVIPFDRGGSNTIDNIVRCCLTDQRKKFTKSPEEYEQHQQLTVTCALPGCGVVYHPRWAEWINGRARYHSLSCAAKSRWV